MLIPVIQGLVAVTLQNAFLQLCERPSEGQCLLPGTAQGCLCRGGLEKVCVLQGVKK